MLGLEVVTTAGYLVATVLMGIDLSRKESRFRSRVLLVLFAAFAIATVDLVLHSLHAMRGGHLPFAGASRVLNGLSWAFIVVVLTTQARSRRFPVAVLLTPLAFVASLLAVFLRESAYPVRGAFTTALFVLHVGILLFGIGAVGLSFLASLLYLVQRRELKSKRFGRLLSFLPPLEVLDRTAVRSLWLGIVLLTVGNATGIYLAHVYWKVDWISQKKFVFSMLTWWWFLGVLGFRHLLGWRGRRFFVLVVIGFSLLLLTFVLSVVKARPWI